MENAIILQDVSPPANVSDAPPVYKQHKRNYQACEACRVRKTKCYQGNPDDPRPPCLKCQREKRQCVFASVRRKRKKTDGTKQEDEDDVYNEGHQPRARKLDARRSSIESNSPDQSPQGSPHAEHLQQSGDPSRDPIQDEEIINEGALELASGRITSHRDAMMVLAKAGQTVEQSAKVKFEEEARQRLGLQSGDTNSDMSLHRALNDSNLDPAITDPDPHATPKTWEVLRIWERLRVVQAGWFTAEEAMDFVDYYYQYLAPQTPITHPDLRQLDKIPKLLSEEPILTLTILTIASRYMRVTGHGNGDRSMMIHQNLWQVLQNMTTRMFWSQEQFGGGFCKAGARNGTPDMENRSRLRSLGSVESLLLLSEFHPRAMHFPPSDINDDILEPDEETLRARRSMGPGAHLPGQSAVDGWTETAIRSDRMSWSLICFAHTLACELGVFGTYASGRTADAFNEQHLGNQNSQTQRADRIGRLLFIFMTQACGRYGLPSLYPQERIEYYRRDIDNHYEAGDARINANLGMDDIIQQYWTEAISINKYCNDALFPSREKTMEHMSSGDYIPALQNIVPVLNHWEKRLQAATIPRLMKVLLSIEVNYFQAYVNGIALQFLLEQYYKKASNQQHPVNGQSPTSSTSSHISEVYSKNEEYVKNVRNACRKILSHVVHDLAKLGDLRHTPVRAHFRIMSAGGFFLKTFCVGNKRGETEKDIRLLKEAVKALRKSVADDVHLSLRIADILEKTTAFMDKRSIPFAPQVATSPSQASFATTRQATPSNNVNLRMIRKTRTDSSSTPTFLGAPNSTLNVFPPPQGMYPPPRPRNAPSYDSPIQSDLNYSPNNPTQFEPLQSPQYASQPEDQNNFFSSGDMNYSNSIPNDEDWMTVPLNSWMSENGFERRGDPMSFGNVFGPETHNNVNMFETMTSDWTSDQQQGGMGF